MVCTIGTLQSYVAYKIVILNHFNQNKRIATSALKNKN